MILREAALSGVFVVEAEAADDERGSFVRLFDRQEFLAHGLAAHVDHVAVSSNRVKGTLRGLHYQAEPHGQAKLIRCSAGAIYDVLVDVRAGSPTYLRCLSFELRAADRISLYVPAGFAHGFETLEDVSDVHYQISSARRTDAERGLRWDDPALGIPWPFPPVVMSERDRSWPLLPSP